MDSLSRISPTQACPQCASSRFRLNGKNRRSGLQKYLCKECGRTYTRSSVMRDPVQRECTQCGNQNVKRNGKQPNGKQGYQCRDCRFCFVDDACIYKKAECHYCQSRRTQKAGMAREQRNTTQRWMCLDCRRYFRSDYLPQSWALDYVACIGCGTSSRRHQANGLCIDCANLQFRASRPDYHSEWKQTNKEKVCHYSHVRREHARANGPVCSPSEYKAFAQGMVSCIACGSTKNLTVDHRTPLVRGGLHQMGNFIALCKRCNCRKATKTWEEFARGDQLLLDSAICP